MRRLALIVILCNVFAAALAAQTGRPGSLRVTVRDATELPIAGAEVIVTSAAGISQRTPTNERGVADLDGLSPGPVTIRIEAPGFDPAALSTVSVRAGSRTTREVQLAIAGFVDQVDVLPVDADQQRDQAFATDLSADEIAALPEDPDELAAMLAQLAGDDAEIRVDGFLDGALPPGTQIQSVRIRYDAASASSSGGGPRIEIRTQPGGDRWRSNASLRVRDETLNARNVFSPTRPTGQTRSYSWSLNGPIVRNRTGLNITFDRTDAVDQQAIQAATPTGVFSELIRQPSRWFSISTRVEHALTPAQRLRVEFHQSFNDATEQGLGELDLPERAFARHGSDGELRIGHNAQLARQMVNDIRLQARWSANDAAPLSTATAVRVAGAFSSGGAQIQGGRRMREFEFEDELLFSIGARQQITAGVNVESGEFNGDEWRNAGGTFTFASLADLEAGRATTFTQRVGDPTFSYSLYRLGAFVQDDIRVHKNLVVNLGVRHEYQSLLGNWADLAPRLGINWTPSPKWKTAIRGGFNVNFQQYQGQTYEQTLVVNGTRQREIVISGPSYPNPFLSGTPLAQLPPGIIRADADLRTPANYRWTIGIDQPIRRVARVRVNYQRQSGHHLFRAVDVNAPIGGVRPDASARNITEIRSIAGSLNQSLELNLQLNYRPHNLNVRTTYTLGESLNETDGQLTLPQDSFNLEQEWGPSRQDVRHRFDLSLNSDLWLGFRVNGNFRAQSESPYTITTGVDANGDGVNNERQPGIGRNSARGSGSKNIDLTLTWQFGVGQRPVRPGPPVPNRAAPAAPNRPAPVMRFEFYAQANNALNFVNYQGYSGVLTSPFFGRPTSASNPRRISVGIRAFY